MKSRRCLLLAVLWLGLAAISRAQGPPVLMPAPGPAPQPAAVAETASIQIQRVGPAAINVGQRLAYEIVVRNVGTSPVNQVRVEEDLPAGAKFLGAEPHADVRDQRLVWAVDRLDAGAERRFKVEVQPNSEGDLRACATVTVAATACWQTRVTLPKLAIRKTGPENVHIDDPAAFQIQITNVGTGPATGVLLRDQLPPGLKHPQGNVIEADIGTLMPGESKDITLETTAVQVGRHVNEAVVTGDGGLRASAQAAVTVTQGQLTLSKKGPSFRYRGREAEFDLEVHNPGSAPATSVRVIDTLPEGLEFLTASDGGAWEPMTRQVTWLLGTLGAGQRHGLKLKVLAKDAGVWVNRAVAQADHGLEAKAEATLKVEGVSALMLEVVDLDDPIEVGHQTTYEIRVGNQGSSHCTGLRIEATVPAEMVPVDAEGPSRHRIQGQQVIFEPLPPLAARADARFLVKVKAARPGDVRFRVLMYCEQLDRPVLEEESTRIYQD